MKLFLSTPAMLFATALLGMSQTTVSRNNSASSGRNAVEANRVWAEAFARCNTSRLSEAIADDCILTNEYGDVASKAAFLGSDQWQHPENCTATDLTVDDVKVQTFGGAFVVTGRMMKTDNGRRVGLRYTNVYVMRRGRWQLVTSQVTHISSSSIDIKITPPKSPN